MDQGATAFGMARAVDCLASSFLIEVDQRCQAIESRLREDLEAQVLGRCDLRIDDRLTALLADFRKELRRELHAEFGTAKPTKDISTGISGPAEPISPKSRTGSRTRSPQRARSTGRLPSEGPSGTGLDSGTHLQDLRALCEGGLERLQARLDEALDVVYRMDLASSANASEIEQLCSDHMAATRKALQEMRAAEEELRSKLLAVEERVSPEHTRYQRPVAVESALEEQVQSLRDQLLNLSMRISELTMSCDGQALQSFSEECREELQRHMQAVRRVEQKVDRTALSGRQVLDRLRRQHAEVVRRHAIAQHAMEADFRELLEELRQNSVVVDEQRFSTIGAGSGDGAARESAIAELNANEDLCKTM